MNRVTILKVLGGVLAGAVLLTAGGMVLAKDKGFFGGGKPPMGQFGGGRGFGNEANSEQLKATLANLVKAGTLTQEQADKITAACEKAMQDAKALAEKMKTLTPEQRREQMQKNKGDFKKRPNDPLNALVEDKTITKEQLTAIRKAMQDSMQAQQKQAVQDKAKENLSKLIKVNALTQEQADKIIAAFNQFAEQKKADMDKVKDMTAEQRKEYFDNQAKDKKGPLDQLVIDKVITQDQADVAAKFVGPQQGFGKGPMNRGGKGEGFEKGIGNKGKGFNPKCNQCPPQQSPAPTAASVS